MSHFRTSQHGAKKRNLFTNQIASRPKKLPKLEIPQCSACSMRSVTRCELPSCQLPLCARHAIRKAGGNLCPRHKNALLVQYDGLPTERFGDRGDAVPHAAKI